MLHFELLRPKGWNTAVRNSVAREKDILLQQQQTSKCVGMTKSQMMGFLFWSCCGKKTVTLAGIVAGLLKNSLTSAVMCSASLLLSR